MPYKFLNRQLLWILMIIILTFLFFNPFELKAEDIGAIKIANISYKGFTVSWVSDWVATGGIRLYEGNNPGSSYEVIGDARGDSYEGYTHYVDVKEGLSPNTTYYFAVECGGSLDDNNGALYAVKIAPPDELPPPANDDCAAGYIEDINGNLIDDAVVYLRVINGSSEESSELSCYSVNGLWLIPLAPARAVQEGNAGGYFKYSYNTDHIRIYASAGLNLGSASKTLAINQSYGIILTVIPIEEDTTPPQLSIVSPYNNEHVRGTITILGTASDDSGIESVSVKIGDGLPGSASGKESWSYGFDTTQVIDGTYIITVRAIDASTNANQGEAQISIIVDNTPPVINISSITHGAYYNHSVQPVIEITEDHIQGSQIKLNGNAFISGQTVIADGSYTLSVSAQDKAGNSASTAYDFVIDTESPFIDISGVDDGACYQDGATPTINISDDNLDSGSISTTLNGNPYVSGTPITADGRFTLIVSAEDKANNPAEKAITFQVGPCAGCNFISTITAIGQDVGGGVSKESSVTLGIIDSGYEVPALSDPMGGSTVKMLIVSPDRDLSECYKTTGAEYESWLLKVFINDSYANDQLPGYYPTLIWDPEVFSACSTGYFKLYLSDPNGRSYYTLVEDMLDQNTYQIKQEHMGGDSQDIYLKLVWSQSQIIEMNLPAEWSMISLSVEPASFMYPDNFPSALAVYRFVPGTGYKKVQVNEPLEIKEGYWIYLNQAKNFYVTGSSISDYSFDIQGDWWHMIGASSAPSKISIDSNSIHNIYFSAYKFVPGTGYKKLDADERLMPGFGYWLWVSETSRVTVQGFEKMMRYKTNYAFNSGPVRSRMMKAEKADKVWESKIIINGQEVERAANKDSIYHEMKEEVFESIDASSLMQMKAKDLEENKWEMMIAAARPKGECLNMNISSVYIGVKESNYEIPALPAPMEGASVEMSIVKGFKNLVEDFRTSGVASEVWTLRIEITGYVDSVQADCYPRITWNPKDIGPGVMKLVLGDTKEGPVLIDNMGNVTFYQVLDIDAADGDGISFYTIIYSPDIPTDVETESYQSISAISSTSISTIISDGLGSYDAYGYSQIYHWLWNGCNISGISVYGLYVPGFIDEGFGSLISPPFSMPLFEMSLSTPLFCLPSLSSMWFSPAFQGARLGYPYLGFSYEYYK